MDIFKVLYKESKPSNTSFFTRKVNPEDAFPWRKLIEIFTEVASEPLQLIE